MGRKSTMARFDECIPDEKVVGHCVECREQLFAGYNVVKFEYETFCNVDCFVQYMGVKTEPIFV